MSTNPIKFIPVSASGSPGFSQWTLRQMPSPTRGVRLVVPEHELTAHEMAAAMVLATHPDSVITDISAVRLWGLPLPMKLTTVRTLMSVAVHPGQGRPQRSGVRGRRMRLPSDHVVELQGLRVTTPARTWLDCAAMVPPAEVLALGDAILRSELATLPELQDMTSWGTRRRGVATCRRLLEWLDGGAESPGESRVRFELLSANIPKPRCNVDIYDQWGRWLARADMAWETERVILEYDGAVHLQESQRRRDAQRRNRLQDDGWLVIVVTVEDLRTPWLLTSQVSRALESRRPNC